MENIAPVILSVLAMVVLAIPLLIIAAAVKFTSKGPVLFWQKRIGKGKKTFMMPQVKA